MADDLHLKYELIALSQEAENTGLCLPQAGNFSVFSEEHSLFYITPSALPRRALLPEQLAALNLAGEVVAWDGEHKPSSESLMHLAIYKARRDVRAICHTHSSYACILALLGKALPPLLYENASLGQCPRADLVPYYRPGTAALAKATAFALREADVCLLARHGAVAVGTSLREAMLRARYLEELAKIYYLASLAGEKLPILSEEEIAAHIYPPELKFPQES